MLESKVDDELEQLGTVRTDVHAIVTRWIGEKLLTLDEVDSLLANLADEGGVSALELARESASAPAQTPIRAAPAPEPVTEAAAAAVEPAVVSTPALTPAPLSESPLTASAAPLFESRPAPASNPPAVFDSRPPPSEASGLTASVFDEKPEHEDPEAQAQAIVAAFEQPEVDTNATEALAAELESSLTALEASTRAAAAQNARAADTGRPPRRLDRGRGSRRPDLNELLDQPLDALDFERTEPEDAADAAADVEARHSEMPTGAPPPAAAGDDFEILVDDEILEIAEDDVEIVNDDEEDPT